MNKEINWTETGNIIDMYHNDYLEEIIGIDSYNNEYEAIGHFENDILVAVSDIEKISNIE